MALATNLRAQCPSFRCKWLGCKVWWNEMDPKSLNFAMLVRFVCHCHGLLTWPLMRTDVNTVGHFRFQTRRAEDNDNRTTNMHHESSISVAYTRTFPTAAFAHSPSRSLEPSVQRSAWVASGTFLYSTCTQADRTAPALASMASSKYLGVSSHLIRH